MGIHDDLLELKPESANPVPGFIGWGLFNVEGERVALFAPEFEVVARSVRGFRVERVYQTVGFLAEVTANVVPDNRAKLQAAFDKMATRVQDTADPLQVRTMMELYDFLKDRPQ